jgi:hypothetical protein
MTVNLSSRLLLRELDRSSTKCGPTFVMSVLLSARVKHNHLIPLPSCRTPTRTSTPGRCIPASFISSSSLRGSCQVICKRAYPCHLWDTKSLCTTECALLELAHTHHCRGPSLLSHISPHGDRVGPHYDCCYYLESRCLLWDILLDRRWWQTNIVAFGEHLEAIVSPLSKKQEIVFPVERTTDLM